MKGNYEEYKQTPHFKNPSGVQAGCPDCHVPRPYGAKLVAKIMAAKDVYHEILGTIDTQEKFEAHRWDMASRVWAKMKANDSRECRACHEFQNMDVDNQSKQAKRRHVRVMEKGGKTCIDCHAGIAHKLPDTPEGAVMPGDEDEQG
jgi:cytochrome c-type protein NapC